MLRHAFPALLAGAAGLALWAGLAAPAQAQCPPGAGGGPMGGYPSCPDCSRMYHYPFYYFPHNYWPAKGPQWPEPPGKCYTPPPSYMALPPFKDPKWRYEYWEPQHYHRGSHFWLDIF